MQKKKQNNKRIIILSILSIIVLVLGALILYAQFHKDNNQSITSEDKSGINYGPPKTAEKQAAEQNKINQYEQKPSQPTPKSITISSIKLDDKKNVIVQTRLSGTGWSRCTLKLTIDGAPPVIISSDVLYQPEYSICQGFSINPSSFAKNGIWSATLSASNSNGTTSTSDPVNISIGT